MGETEIIRLISSLEWRFAKTMPEIPHEYIVIDDYPEKQAEINRFIAEIHQKGYTKMFYGKEYKYLEMNEVIPRSGRGQALSGAEGSRRYKYWVIENTSSPSKLQRSGIINRAKINS